MRKILIIISLVLILAIPFVFVGCGGNNNGNDELTITYVNQGEVGLYDGWEIDVTHVFFYTGGPYGSVGDNGEFAWVYIFFTITNLHDAERYFNAFAGRPVNREINLGLIHNDAPVINSMSHVISMESIPLTYIVNVKIQPNETEMGNIMFLMPIEIMTSEYDMIFQIVANVQYPKEFLRFYLNREEIIYLENSRGEILDYLGKGV